MLRWLLSFFEINSFLFSCIMGKMWTLNKNNDDDDDDPMGWKACTWFCWYLHVKLTEWSKNLFVSLVFLLFILILNPLRALWHIRSTLVNANHSCCVPGAQPGPMSIHCLSFLSRLIFSMSPLIFLVYACPHLVSILWR